MPYPNEHAARINLPGKFEQMRRKNDEFGDGIDVIFGITRDGKTEVQAIRFDKTKFTVEQARKWLKDHNYKPIEFEKAKESEALPVAIEATPIRRGVRVQVHCENTESIKLLTTDGIDRASSEPEIVAELKKNSRNFPLAADGVIVEGRLYIDDILVFAAEDIHNEPLSLRRDRRAIPAGSETVIFEAGVVAETDSKLAEAIEEVSKNEYSEGARLRLLNSGYSLNGETEAEIEIGDQLSLKAEVLEATRAADSPALNYTLNLRSEDGRIVPLGKFYNVLTDQQIPIGGIVRVCFESLKVYNDTRTGETWFSARNPRSIKYLPEEQRPDTETTARTLAREIEESIESKNLPKRYALAIRRRRDLYKRIETEAEYLAENFEPIADLNEAEGYRLRCGAVEEDIIESRKAAKN